MNQLSDLSSAEYWEYFYKNELENFYATKDVGEIWFGKSNLNKMVKWISDCPELTKNDAIIDIGSGNGVLLYNLYEKGYSNLTGLDFSLNAVKLAQGIANHFQMNIHYEVSNFLIDPIKHLNQKYKLCIDKGTFDAITLNKNQNECISIYINSLNQVISPCGIFFIVSCNWTKPELQTIFKNDFETIDEIATPTFTFSSSKGNTVTSLILKKRH